MLRKRPQRACLLTHNQSTRMRVRVWWSRGQCACTCNRPHLARARWGYSQGSNSLHAMARSLSPSTALTCVDTQGMWASPDCRHRVHGGCLEGATPRSAWAAGDPVIITAGQGWLACRMAAAVQHTRHLRGWLSHQLQPLGPAPLAAQAVARSGLPRLLPPVAACSICPHKIAPHAFLLQQVQNAGCPRLLQWKRWLVPSYPCSFADQRCCTSVKAIQIDAGPPRNSCLRPQLAVDALMIRPLIPTVRPLGAAWRRVLVGADLAAAPRHFPTGRLGPAGACFSVHITCAHKYLACGAARPPLVAHRWQPGCSCMMGGSPVVQSSHHWGPAALPPGLGRMSWLHPRSAAKCNRQLDTSTSTVWQQLAAAR
jgi:hypothetical protein